MAVWTNDPDRINYFATTHTRGTHRAFGIRAKDRDKHFYAIGKSGMGKSTLLENMAIQDIQNGEGVVFVDPHGSTAEKLLDFVPEDRVKDVLYLAPFDTDYPVGFNILEDVGYDKRHKVVAGLMGVFERIWADSWSARMQYILQNTLFALLEYPGATIIDVNRMLVNKAFRAEVVEYITDPVVASFWKEEFANYGDRYTQEATPAIQNKIGQFVSNPLIRNILGQAKSTFDLRQMMDERKIVIVNLSKGRMGEANAALLGSMIVIKVYLAALSRAEEPASTLAKIPPCYFYVDEFQNVVNEAFENILSEARKYKLCLTIANQYIEQMPEEVRNAVFGNVGSTVIFRVGPMDAQFLEPVFAPTFIPEDMVGLGRGEIYLTLMIDGVGSAPFSAHTLPPIEEPGVSFRELIVNHTRRTYGKPRQDIEEVIRGANDKWQEAAKAKHKEDSAKGPKSGPPGRFGPSRVSSAPPRNEVRERPALPPVREEPPQTRAPSAPVEATPRAAPPVPNSVPKVSEATPSRVVAPAQKSPAELMRERMSSRTPVQPVSKNPTSTRVPDREHSERNALKAAIASIRTVAPPTVSAQPRPTHPAAVKPPIKHPSTPQSVVRAAEPPLPPPNVPPVSGQRKRDDVDPEVLRRLLHAEE